MSGPGDMKEAPSLNSSRQEARPLQEQEQTLTGKTDSEVIDIWTRETNFDQRDKILKVLIERKLFPKDETATVENDGALYPDVDDPLFIAKLLRKREFAENKQRSMAEILREGEDLCDPTREFEISPVQRFITRFLSPETPYNSALLFHGVGVGKTCAAISTAEAYLEKYPRKQVIIIAPPNIQSGFERTIFDIHSVKFGDSEDAVNEAHGCTGNTYLRLTNTEFVREKNLVQARVTKLIRKRYLMYGYLEFYNYVNKIMERVPKGIPPERRAQIELQNLRSIFSGRLIMIDEAHNLRDIGSKTETETDEDNIDAGKKLTPVLRRILDVTEGTKLMLLTATPMYNSYREIIFLFNLLLRNDKKAEISDAVVFKQGALTDIGKKLLGNTASAYMSFMRGENPLSFPIRLEAEGVPRVTRWSTIAPNGAAISDVERERMVHLPLIKAEFTDDALRYYDALTRNTIESKGMGVNTVDLLVQAGNWLFPGASRVREEGFSSSFDESSRGSLKTFQSKTGPPTWLKEDQLSAYSPKAALLIKRLRTSKGVAFVYSRFVKSGALTLALALEANGYTLAGRELPFLQDGVQTEGGRQCARCPLKEKEHKAAGHPFVAAKYVMLTGRSEYSPNNKQSVEMARSEKNKFGEEVKVVLGSQVAAEGIDLRFIRDIYVFDSWFHLNKLEQVLGRGIRMCSHALLPPEDRNCTIHLLVNAFPESSKKETMDFYMYRIAMEKAVTMGILTRFLKMNALDCNLNRDAILIQGLPARRQVDSQGKERPSVNVNDMPYTSVCDWIESCDYKCAKPVDVDEMTADTSTYDEYSARYRESTMKDRLRELFKKQAFYKYADFKQAFADIPEISLVTLLSSVVDNRSFQIQTANHKGFITFRNGFYLFQPDHISDTRLPIALRVATYPVKRDIYQPITLAPNPQDADDDGEDEGETQGKDVEAAEEVDVQGVLRFWTEFTKWFSRMKGGPKDGDVSTTLVSLITARYSKNKNELRRMKEILEMITYFYVSIYSSPELVDHYQSVLYKFLWDEILTNAEQIAIFGELADDADLLPVWEEQVLESDGSIAFRNLNPTTGKIEYMCDGKPCNDAIIKLLEDPENDPYQNIKADSSKTGEVYGTVNFKRGIFVFKTNRPVAPGKKPDVGSECGNVSTVSAHMKLIKEIGDLSTRYARTSMGLQTEVLEGARTFKKNSNKVCMLTDLALRMLDSMGTNGKRWFYRPISTIKTGHRGLLRK
jgi:Type III restriction enzyme, res subunit